MVKESLRYRVEKWLKEKGHLINFTAFEREIKVSKGVVQKFVKNNKKIKDQHIRRLFKLIKKFGDI